MKSIKVIVEKHPDGYIAYPLGLKGVVVSEGDSYEEAMTNVKSAIRFHIGTFGEEAFTDDAAARSHASPILGVGFSQPHRPRQLHGKRLDVLIHEESW